jgi:hypothetical protein
LLVGMHVEFMEGVDAEATSWELEVTNWEDEASTEVGGRMGSDARPRLQAGYPLLN